MTVEHLGPKDIIAIVVLMILVFLIYNNTQGPFTELLALVIGYYFGNRKAGVDSGN